MRTIKSCITICLLIIVSMTHSAAAWAACASPAGNEQAIIYNADYKTYQFCDGTSWQSMKSGSPSPPPPLPPAGNDGEVQFNDGGAIGASTNLFWDNTNGRLAVRNTTPDTALDVAGEIKIGSTGGACNASSEGAIRYDAGSKTVKFCNGSSWTTNATPGRGLKSISLFTSDGTWNKPAGVNYIKVAVVAGGGGGASGASTSERGGGGGGGGTCIEYIDVSGVSSVSVTVGAGGTGGAIGTNPGNAGGSSSFGTYCTANGGAGGETSGQGGLGGTASGGHINVTGGGGGSNSPGGSAFGGRDGPYGSGSWGHYSDSVGENGHDGAVIVWEYGS